MGLKGEGVSIALATGTDQRKGHGYFILQRYDL